jgi:hypothetical protein
LQKKIQKFCGIFYIPKTEGKKPKIIEFSIDKFAITKLNFTFLGEKSGKEGRRWGG